MAQPSSSAKQEVKQAGQEIKHTAQSVGEHAKEAASAMADKAKDVASTVGHKAEDATHAVGSGMQSLGGSIREHGPQSGFLGSATSTVAGGLESGGRYLQEEGLSGMGRDLTELIRRNPVTSMLIGVGIGYMLARFTRS